MVRVQVDETVYSPGHTPGSPHVEIVIHIGQLGWVWLHEFELSLCIVQDVPASKTEPVESQRIGVKSGILHDSTHRCADPVTDVDLGIVGQCKRLQC